MAISSYSAIPIPNSPLVDKEGIISHIWYLFFKGLANGVDSHIRQVVTNGFSLTVPPGIKNVILDPAGVLANGTLTMPASATDGQEIVFITGQTITACTFSANVGQTILNAPTTLVAGTNASFLFSQSTASWYKK